MYPGKWLGAKNRVLERKIREFAIEIANMGSDHLIPDGILGPSTTYKQGDPSRGRGYGVPVGGSAKNARVPH